MEQGIWLSGCCLLNGKCKFSTTKENTVESWSKSGVLASVHVHMHKATDFMQFLFVKNAVMNHLIYWLSNDVILPAEWAG